MADKVTIARIESAGPGSQVRRIHFSDFLEPILAPASVVRVLGLSEGDSYDLEALERSIAAVAPDCARERALRILGYRERSSTELASKLRADGYTPDVVATVVARFTEVQLLDDARFAASFVRMREARGLGSRRIAQELARKGITGDEADALLAESSHSEIGRARTVLGGRTPVDRRDRERLMRKLVARGFSPSVAREALDSPADEDDVEA